MARLTSAVFAPRSSSSAVKNRPPRSSIPSGVRGPSAATTWARGGPSPTSRNEAPGENDDREDRERQVACELPARVPQVLEVEHQPSARSAVMGFTLAARRAGTNAARPATTNNIDA